MMPRKDLDKLAGDFAMGAAGAITAALITEGGTFIVSLTAATIAGTIYAKGKIDERKKKTKVNLLKNQPPTGTINLKTLFKGLSVDEDFIIAVYWNDGERSVSIVGHKNPQIARKLKEQKVLLPMGEILRLADHGDVRFLSL